MTSLSLAHPVFASPGGGGCGDIRTTSELLRKPKNVSADYARPADIAMSLFDARAMLARGGSHRLAVINPGAIAGHSGGRANGHILPCNGDLAMSGGSKVHAIAVPQGEINPQSVRFIPCLPVQAC